MSQTNPPGEEGDDHRDPVSEDFEFYFPFAKTLALDLPTPEDTSIAAAWVQKLEAEPESEGEKLTRLNYLKLLLFVLQRGRLSGIFRKQPPSGALQPFPQGLTVLDMGNLMLDQDDSPTCGEGDARCLPYNTEISNDLREFVASQEIPDFGVQMYYAWSFDEPVHKWLGFDEEKFPQFVLDKIKQLKEVKSDERSTTVKNGCIGPKTGCDLSLIEKTCKKKVKSPQEIEKSQGRSFHTYVGLVGRMGNFNDKCGDDQDKCPRPDSRKGKCARRNLLKQFPGSGGEAEDMEDDVSLFLAGGLNSFNRPCLCPMIGGPRNFPEQCGKATPQHSFQEQQSPRVNYTFSLGDRNQAENAQWGSPDLESTPIEPRQYNEEQCLEPSMVQQMPPSQRRSPSPRPKSTSANRPNFDCPLQDEGEFYKRDGVCCCTSPPCTCPCPRVAPPKKAPSSANGGRVTGEQSTACMRQGGGGYRTNREDPCAGAAQGPSSAPSGTVRPGGSPRPPTRNKSPQIIHCYDGEAPDPSLTQTVSKIESMSWSEEGDCSPFPEDFIKDYFGAEKSPSPGFQRLSSPQREVYDPCQQQPKAHATTCPAASGMKQKSDRSSPVGGQRPPTPPSARPGRTPSPAAPRPIRQVQQEPQQPCRPNQQYVQNYQECAKAPQPRPAFGNVCAPPPDVSIQSNQENYSFLDKFPPECGFTPVPYENVFRRPPAEAWSPESPNWNQPENLYEFLDKCSFSTSGLSGFAPSLSDDECFKSTLDSTQSPSHSGTLPEDIYTFIEKRFPGNPPATAPSGGGRPSNRPRPGVNEACGRPSPEPCPPQSQTGNQPEDLYAFLEKNFPPRVPPNSPQTKKSARIANVNSLLQGINLRREAHREKCEQSGPRKSPGPDVSFCQPQANACPEQTFTMSGGMISNYGGECRTPRGPVCQDTGACRRQPTTAPANMDRGPPNRACTNLPPSFQGKSTTFVSQQPLPPRQPMPGAYAGAGQATCDPDEEEEDECESSESAVDVCPKESVPMYVLPCPPQRAPGRPPQQGQGPSRSVQQCSSGWPGMQGGATPRPAPGRTGRNEPPSRPNEADMRSCPPQRATPGKTPQQEQCTYRGGEVQNMAPKRIAPGKTYEQETNIYREPSVRPTSPRKVIPEGYNETFERMPSAPPQMQQQGYATPIETPLNKELTVQTSSHKKKSSGKAVEEKRDEGWVIMRSSPSPMSRQGYECETGSGEEAEKQVCPSGRPSPGKASLQDFDATEYLGVQVNATLMPSAPSQMPSAQPPMPSAQPQMLSAQPQMPSAQPQMPNTWVSFKAREEPPRARSNESDAQSCPPQNVNPGKAVRPAQSTEDWFQFTGAFTENVGSRSSQKDDEPPTWQTFEWRSKLPPPPPSQAQPQPEGSVPKATNIPSPSLPRRKSLGKPASQEPPQSYPQPAGVTRSPSPRPQLSQNKLSRQKSSSRTYQSVTDTKSKSVRKSNPNLSKSETRSAVKTASAAKIEPKPKPKIKSETQMKINSSQKQTEIKSEIKMKFRPNSIQKTKCVLKDLTYENTRRMSQQAPQQTSCKEQEGMLYCCSQIQNVVRDCAEQAAANYRGNPYVENSLAYHKTLSPPLIRNSSPIESISADPRNNIPNLTSICQYNSRYDYTTSNQQTQTDFGGNQGENSDRLPLYTQNADISAGKFFNLPQTSPQNDSCPQESFVCPTCPPRNMTQGLPFHSCQDASASVVYSDNTDSGCYRIYYQE